jgi:uncharacterized protein with PQ loop repeat
VANPVTNSLSHTTNVTLPFPQVPQLIQNYRTGSAEAISITFLSIWFVGDVCNLIGAVWAGLVPTVIALAVYFCIADSVLISQCLYYNYKNRKQLGDKGDASSAVEDGDHEADEEEPLLSRRTSTASGQNVGLPGSTRRKSSAASQKRRAESDHAMPKIDEEPEEDESSAKAMLYNVGVILLICAVGAAGWAICWKTGIWKPEPMPGSAGDGTAGQEATPIGAEILGYASAVLYLGARLPQIAKNWREKSCEGLSLLFFLLSLLGNLTYGAGVSCVHIASLHLMLTLPRSLHTVLTADIS